MVALEKLYIFCKMKKIQCTYGMGEGQYSQMSHEAGSKSGQKSVTNFLNGALHVPKFSAT